MYGVIYKRSELESKKYRTGCMNMPGDHANGKKVEGKFSIKGVRNVTVISTVSKKLVI